MSQPAAPLRLSAEEYLTWEREQLDRHDFHAGEVFAMAGGSPRHNALVANVVAGLVTALRGGPCRALSSDQRIVLETGKRYVYADASVVCGSVRLREGTTDVLENPSAVIEVLSPRTEAYDRGLKWEGYQRLPSLLDYLLVSQHTMRVEHYQRESDGTWKYRVVEEHGTVVLSNGARLEVDEVFVGVFELETDER
jgi:Uma2 family endonuclease